MEISRLNNFGLLRYLMAFSIVVGHFNFLTGSSLPVPLSAYDCVGGFFVLSGFFVNHSYTRAKSLGGYIRRRARRLLPPYVLIVVGCALGLSAVSTLPAADYFTSGQLYGYLAANLTFLNFLQPDLPGVFASSPMAAVNASLWTLKEEWMLYLLFPATLWLMRRCRLGLVATLAAVYLGSAAYRAAMVYYGMQTGNAMFIVMSRQVFGCMSFFFTGVALHFFFAKFSRHRNGLFVAAIILFAVSYTSVWWQILLRPAAIGVILIYLGTTGKWGHWAASHGNISYEIYLFHFPVIQLAVAAGLPAAAGETGTFAAVLAAVVVLGALSWHFIDSRFLRR